MAGNEPKQAKDAAVPTNFPEVRSFDRGGETKKKSRKITDFAYSTKNVQDINPSDELFCKVLEWKRMGVMFDHNEISAFENSVTILEAQASAAFKKQLINEDEHMLAEAEHLQNEANTLKSQVKKRRSNYNAASKVEHVSSNAADHHTKMKEYRIANKWTDIHKAALAILVQPPTKVKLPFTPSPKIQQRRKPHPRSPQKLLPNRNPPRPSAPPKI